MCYRTNNTPSREEEAAYYRMKNARAKTARQFNIEAKSEAEIKKQSPIGWAEEQAILNSMSVEQEIAEQMRFE